MKRFFDESEIGRQVVVPLRQRAVAYFEFEGDEGKYELIKIGKRAYLRPGKSKKAEVRFRVGKEAVGYLFDTPLESVKDYVHRLCDCLEEKDPAKKVEMKMLTNFFDFWFKGYFGLLKMGGSRAIRTLAKIGIKVPRGFVNR
ncbi:MAG: hypothetical protein ABIH66_00885 [bacterium]